MSDTDATQARQDVAADVDEILENVINANTLSMPYDVYVELFDAVAGLGVEIENLQSENAKLRELVADMYGFIKRMDEDCGDVTFSDCFDYCKHDTADDGCCKTGECWYEQRMRELGIEVSE